MKGCQVFEKVPSVFWWHVFSSLRVELNRGRNFIFKVNAMHFLETIKATSFVELWQSFIFVLLPKILVNRRIWESMILPKCRIYETKLYFLWRTVTNNVDCYPQNEDPSSLKTFFFFIAAFSSSQWLLLSLTVFAFKFKWTALCRLQCVYFVETKRKWSKWRYQFDWALTKLGKQNTGNGTVIWHKFRKLW